MKRELALVATIAASMAARATSAADKALLIELPDQVFPSAVSSDMTVVGGLGQGGGFYWLPTSGLVLIGGKQALSTSRDGDTIVGEALDAGGRQQAALWLRGTEWRLLGSIAPNAQPAAAIKPVVTGHMPSQTQLNSEAEAVAAFRPDPDAQK